MKKTDDVILPPTVVKTVQDIGKIIRHERKRQGVRQDRTAGLMNVSVRLLSEVERGRETVATGTLLKMLNRLGLEIVIKKRGR